MSKRKMIIVSLLVLISVSTFTFFKNKNSTKINKEEELTKKTELKIGYITDLHCYSKLNSETNKWELNRRCLQPMVNFKKQMEESFQPDLIVDGGDLVDGRDDQEKVLYPILFKEFQKFEFPSYHILGNHETRGFLKSEWLEFTGYEKPYYYQDIREYRLIFLDGNNKPGENGQSLDTSPDLHYYPGYLDSAQKKWLEEVLKDSEEKTILVFVHQPPLEKTILKTAKDLFFEGDQLRELFSSYGVKAVFSGHIEEMCYIKENGVNYYALEGVHKNNKQLLSADDYKDKGVFHEVTVTEEGELKVEMFFKDKEAEEYNTSMVNNETAVCNEQSIKNPQEYKSLVDNEKEKDAQEEISGEDLNN